jgi:hypothetical protein
MLGVLLTAGRHENTEREYVRRTTKFASSVTVLFTTRYGASCSVRQELSNTDLEKIPIRRQAIVNWSSECKT